MCLHSVLEYFHVIKKEKKRTVLHLLARKRILIEVAFFMFLNLEKAKYNLKKVFLGHFD